VLFGDFSYYNIRDAGGPTFIRADELYVLTHQVAFLAFQRSDGNLIDTTSIRYLRTP
jgi:HK97 family phage major capsid protein